jgi:hypothetical protein
MAFDTTEPVLFTAEDDRTLSLGERVAATEGKRPGEGGADRAAASINDAPLITIRRADHVKRRAAS